jgi:SepF-like predicted cell division protein (DUF552 family)
MIAFFKKFTNKLGAEPEVDVDEYLDTLGIEQEDLLQDEADVWVKPYVLEDVGDTSAIADDLRAGNIVLLNIEPLSKRNANKLKQAVNELKTVVKSLNGDVARLSEFKLIFTPKGVKFAKARR